MPRDRNKSGASTPEADGKKTVGIPALGSSLPPFGRRIVHDISRYGLFGGIWRLLQRIWRRLVRGVYFRDHYYILSFDLQADTIIERPIAGDYRLSKMGINDIADAAALWDDEHMEYKLNQYRRRLESGSVGYITRYQGGIVAACWSATGELEESLLGIKINLQPWVYYGFDAYVHPDFRERGIVTYMITTVMKEMEERGFKRRVAMVHEENLAMLRAHTKMGQRVVGELILTRFFGVPRHVWEIDDVREHSTTMTVGV